MVVFLNKMDQCTDPELVDLVEMEIQELLTAHGYPGEDIPITKGSAKLALAGDT